MGRCGGATRQNTHSSLTEKLFLSPSLSLGNFHRCAALFVIFWPTIFHCNAFWPFLYFYLIYFPRIRIRSRNCKRVSRRVARSACASERERERVSVRVCVACGCVGIFDFHSRLRLRPHQQSHSQPQLRRSPSNNNALLNSQIVFHAPPHYPSPTFPTHCTHKIRKLGEKKQQICESRTKRKFLPTENLAPRPTNLRPKTCESCRKTCRKM